jgi:tetratricopeptide (TPR) repeat protein
MKTILTSILMLITVISFAQDPPEKYRKIWNEINEGDPAKAQKELKKILKTKPKDPWPYWLMGISFNPYQDKEASAYYEQAIAADSTFAPAYYNLAGSLESNAANFPRIEKLYSKAIELAKESYYYVARASLYQDWKKYDLAIIDCKAAKLIEPENCYFANQIIIQSLYAQGKMDDLKIFLNLNDPNAGGGPPDGEYHFFLGGLYEGWGEPEKACAFYLQAVEDTEFMLDIVDPGVLDEELAQYRAKVKAICK